MISDEKYNEALADPNNMRMMRKATNRFSGSLTQDERYECMLLALYRCLKRFKKGITKNFLSSLYRCTTWECLSAIRSKMSWSPVCIDLVDIAEYRNPYQEEIDHILECMELLSSEDRTLIHQFYIQERTLREMGVIHKCGKKEMGVRLRRAERRLGSLAFPDKEEVSGGCSKSVS